MLLLGPDLHYVGPLVLWGFSQHFSAKYTVGEDQINVLSSERKALGTVPYGKSDPGYCIMFKKRLDEGLTLQLLGQKPLISPTLIV